MNFLEQLAAEWYDYQGYFVRRNTLAGQRKAGGFECELDVVAFHPTTRHVVQIEPSMDAHSWAERERRYKKKFEAGRRYIPHMFPDLKHDVAIDQIAIFGLSKRRVRTEIAGGKVWLVSDLLSHIVSEVKLRRVHKEAVPEGFPLLRTVQFVCEHSRVLFPNDA